MASWEEYLNQQVPPAPPAPSPQAPSWAQSLGREAGIAGTRLLAPSAGLAHSVLGMGPSYDQVLAMGPTPQGKGENILATAATAGGYALPAAALMLGGEAALLPESMTGLSLLGNTLRPAGAMLASAVAGGGAGEARRQFFKDMPGGPLVDLSLGMMAGGAASGMVGPAWGTAANLGLSGPPAATLPRLGLASLIGSGVDFLGRHFGIPPGLSYWLGQGTELAAARGMPNLQAPGAAGLTGGVAGMLTPSPTNP